MIGHSFGGLVTQILLGRGLGVAGIAIDPAPLKGVWQLPFSALRSSWPVLNNPLNRKKAVSRAAWKKYKANQVTDYKVFAGRGHSLTIDHGWREVAEFSASWLRKQGL